MELFYILVLVGVRQLRESDGTQSWILKRVNICKLYLDLKKTIKNVNSQHCSGLSLHTGRRRCHRAPEGQGRAPGRGARGGCRSGHATSALSSEKLRVFSHTSIYFTELTFKVLFVDKSQ